MVPTLLYLTFRIASTAIRPIRSQQLLVQGGLGDSSSIFCAAAGLSHSRSPRWMMLPCSSATIWISMCRGRST